jgi:hypothetical protein
LKCERAQAIRRSNSLLVRKRPFLTRVSGGCGECRHPIPGEQVVEGAHRVAIEQSFQHVPEIGERLDVVEFGSGQ